MSAIETYRRAGFPNLHGVAFQKVANRLDRIIVCRTRPESSIPLLEEDYATKGFGVKVKTCDFGPFLGFAMPYGALGKLNAARAEYQQQCEWIKDAHKEVFGRPLAGTDTLYLSSNRLQGLRARGHIDFEELRPGEIVRCQGWAGPLQFVLIDAGLREPRWMLAYGGPRLQDVRLVNGFVNYAADGRSSDNRKNCVTSDYDLWGVFPRLESQMADHGMDRQVPIMESSTRHAVGGDIQKRIEQLKQSVRNSATPRTRAVTDPATGQTGHYAYQEDPELGNINFCTYHTAQQLNHELRTGAHYHGGNAVHHNDDLGNPYRKDMERDLIAFVPGDAEPHWIANYGYADWVRSYKDTYKVYRNPAFMAPEAP